MARESPVAQRPPRVPYFLRWTAGSRTKHKTVALSLQLPIHRHHEGVISSSTAAGDPLPSALCSLPWQALERCAAPIPPQLPHLSRLTPRPVAQWPEHGAYLLMSQTGAQGGPPGKNRYLLTARRPSAPRTRNKVHMWIYCTGIGSCEGGGHAHGGYIVVVDVWC